MLDMKQKRKQANKGRELTNMADNTDGKFNLGCFTYPSMKQKKRRTGANWKR